MWLFMTIVARENTPTTGFLSLRLEARRMQMSPCGVRAGVFALRAATCKFARWATGGNVIDSRIAVKIARPRFWHLISVQMAKINVNTCTLFFLGS